MLIDASFEDKVLAGIYRSNEFASVAAQHLRHEYFEGAVKRNIAKLALDFWSVYGTHMTEFAFVEEMKRLVTTGKIKREEIKLHTDEYKRLLAIDLSDWKYVLESIITFIKQREYRAVIEEAIKRYLPKGEIDRFEKALAGVAAITTTPSVEGVDFYSDEEITRRAKRREDEKVGRIRGISTGIKKLDDAMPKGGWCPKELYAISGGAKRGKTSALLWFAHAASLQGFNVVYFSCEVSEDVLSDRLDAMISGTVIKNLSDDVKKVMDDVMVKRPAGKIFFYEYQTNSLTVSEVERKVRNLQMKKGIVVDMIITDYASIMRPERRYKDNELKEEAEIFKEHRRMAGVFAVPVLTGNQNNRAGSKKAISDGTDTAGTWEKIAIVDGNITLSATPEEIKHKTLRIYLSEMRNAAPRSLKISTSFNMGKFYKELIEVEGEEEEE